MKENSPAEPRSRSTNRLDNTIADSSPGSSRPTAMRDPNKKHKAARSSRRRVASAATGHVDYFWLAANRMAFGNSASLIGNWLDIPGTGELKFDNYVEQQLGPHSPPGGIPAIDDSFLDSQMAAANFQYLGWSIPQLWNGLHENRPSGVSRRDGIEEVENATFMRACYSKAQLHEVLADFWHNHFNCWGWDYWSQPVWPSFDALLRNNMLGNFRTLLGSVSQHPAMLYFLDQYTSTDLGPNENYARELFELHTMGSENYYGVIPKSQVPLDGNGKPLGYVDEDVYETARCLSGWTVNNGSSSSDNGQDDGSFYFNLALHDKGLKRVLDVEMPAGTRGIQDGIDVLDALVRHPATARHVTKRLCQRLVSDNPPQSLLNAAAAEFETYWYASDQLARVVRLILKSNEFKSTKGEKAKRPFELAVGAIRGAGAFWEFRDGADDLSSFFWRYDATGQPLFSWPAPDGYPEDRSKWESSTPKVMSWHLSNWMTEVRQPNSGPYRMGTVAQTPPSVTTANEFADWWIARVLAQPMSSTDRDQIVQFVAAGGNPNLDLAFNDSNTAARLRSAVALIINSPYFHER